MDKLDTIELNNDNLHRRYVRFLRAFWYLNLKALASLDCALTKCASNNCKGSSFISRKILGSGDFHRLASNACITLVSIEPAKDAGTCPLIAKHDIPPTKEEGTEDPVRFHVCIKRPSKPEKCPSFCRGKGVLVSHSLKAQQILNTPSSFS